MLPPLLHPYPILLYCCLLLLLPPVLHPYPILLYCCCCLLLQYIELVYSDMIGIRPYITQTYALVTQAFTAQGRFSSALLLYQSNY